MHRVPCPCCCKKFTTLTFRTLPVKSHFFSKKNAKVRQHYSICFLACPIEGSRPRVHVSRTRTPAAGFSGLRTTFSARGKILAYTGRVSFSSPQLANKYVRIPYRQDFTSLVQGPSNVLPLQPPYEEYQKFIIVKLSEESVIEDKRVTTASRIPI